MRVVLDATALPADRGGVGRYVDELVAWLPALGVDLHLAVQPRDAAAFAATLGPGHVHPAPRAAGPRVTRLAWEQTGLPRLVRTLAADLVHSPHYTVPLLSAAGDRPRVVVTLHDATFFSHPELHLGVKARFFRGWTRTAARWADGLVAPSEATRSEIVRHTGVEPRRIGVVPHGVDHERFRPPAAGQVRALRARLELPDGRRYVAFLGTLEPRKNVPALVHAYVTACRDDPDPPTLVLAGGRGWDENIDAAVAAVPPSLTVLRPGFLPDELVPALLGGADVVAYPAFGEGFGLPVLEAMACGAAVLTTPMLSLPEVGGDAVRYAASTDAADISTALRDLLDDPEDRARLGAAAVARAAGFTWEKCARGHLAVYRQALA